MTSEEYLVQLKIRMGNNITKAAFHLVNALKKNLNTSGNPVHGRNTNPSLPGEIPHKALGDLQRSIAFNIAPDKLSATIGTNIDYGMFLEFGTVKMAARPWLQRTLIEEQDAIQRIVSK